MRVAEVPKDYAMLYDPIGRDKSRNLQAMQTTFYGRSLYSYMGDVPVPRYFVELDELLGKESQTSNVAVAIHETRTRHAANLCRRLADVEWYIKCISESVRLESVGKATFLTMTWLVGYFSFM